MTAHASSSRVFVVIVVALGCSSDPDGSPGGGFASTESDAGTPTDGGGSLAADATSDPDGAAGNGDLIEGDLGGQPVMALGSTASLTEVPDRAFLSVSVSEWAPDCDVYEECGKAQVNFTLHAIGGTRANIAVGTYGVASTDRDGVVYEIAGGAGRYSETCAAGFAAIVDGELVLEEATDRFAGTFAFDLEDGSLVSGAFAALTCAGP